MERGQIEEALLKQFTTVIGVDEVGKGCLAGPVYAACAAFDLKELLALPKSTKDLMNDSKKLSLKQRLEALKVIPGVAKAIGIGFCSEGEIEELGISAATFLAMKKAIESLPFFEKAIVLVDGRFLIPNFLPAQQAVIKGDFLCYSIASASIVAKITRDDFMKTQDQLFPHYGFKNHVGYGTKEHLSGIKEHGPCPLHRKNFSPIKEFYL